MAQDRCNKIHLVEIVVSCLLGLVFHFLLKTFCYKLQFWVFLPITFEHASGDTDSICTFYRSDNNLEFYIGVMSCPPGAVSLVTGLQSVIVIPTRAYIPQTTKPPTQRKNPTYRISKRFVTVFSVAIRLKWSFQAVLTQWSSKNVSKYDRRSWATPFKYNYFAFSIIYDVQVRSKLFLSGLLVHGKIDHDDSRRWDWWSWRGF